MGWARPPASRAAALRTSRRSPRRPGRERTDERRERELQDAFAEHSADRQQECARGLDETLGEGELLVPAGGDALPVSVAVLADERKPDDPGRRLGRPRCEKLLHHSTSLDASSTSASTSSTEGDQSGEHQEQGHQACSDRVTSTQLAA
jgi:hypothetical protein